MGLKIGDTLEAISSTRSMILPLTVENRLKVLEGICENTTLVGNFKRIYA